MIVHVGKFDSESFPGLWLSAAGLFAAALGPVSDLHPKACKVGAVEEHKPAYVLSDEQMREYADWVKSGREMWVYLDGNKLGVYQAAHEWYVAAQGAAGTTWTTRGE